MVALPIVLLIFITSSNYRNENLNHQQPTDKTYNKINQEEFQLQEKFNSQVNDLTVSNFKFPDHVSAHENFMEKKIRKEAEANEIKTRKEKAPVPLYSLVKNVCEHGYVMDENGVCQKAIVLKSGKEFDSEKRRRRRRRDLPPRFPVLESNNQSIGKFFIIN